MSDESTPPDSSSSSPVTKKRRRGLNGVCKNSQLPIITRPLNSTEEFTVAGKIKSIRLENFMCHSNFEIHLNPKVNFIVGLNGSGKSSVQTAIVIGLGGRASVTNRSSSVKGLVKQDCNSGSITITLCNSGSEAYKQEIFGDEIVVRRSFTKNGTNSYKIYSGNGKVMGSKKDELDKILAHFHICPSNPIAVLNQDMSKTFFNEVEPRGRYSLFKKATLIDEALISLQHLEEDLKYLSGLLEAKEKALELNYEEIEEMEAKLKLINDLKVNKSKKVQLETELKFSKKKELEDSKQKIENTVVEQENLKKELESKVGSVDKNLASYESMLEELKNKMRNINDLVKSVEDERQLIQDKIRENRQLLVSTKSDCENIKMKIKRKESDILHLQNLIREYETNREEKTLKAQNTLKEIATLKAEISNLEGEVTLCNNSRNAAKNSENEYVVRLRDEQRILSQYRYQIEKNSNDIDHMKKGKDQSLAVYGRWMPELVNRIRSMDRAGKFTATPRGPIGSYIKVNDNKWTPAIESYLKRSLLTAFYVNDAKDRALIYQIMNDVIPHESKPSVYTGKFVYQLYRQVHQNEVKRPGRSNMFRALNISDPVVANFLIDTTRMELILLLPTNEECYALAMPENVPPNCIKAINFEADEFIPHPNFKCYSNVNRTIARFLQEDKSHTLKLLEEDNVKFAKLVKEKETIIQTLSNSVKQYQDEIVRYDELLNKLATNIASKNRHLRRCNDLVNEEEGPSLDQHQEELSQIQKELNILEGQMAEIVNVKLTHDKTVKELEQKLHQVKLRCASSQQSSIEREMTDIKNKHSECITCKENLLARIHDQDVKLQQLKCRTDNIDSKIREIVSTLNEECIIEPRPVQELENEISTTNAYITELERQLDGENVSFEETLWRKKDELEAKKKRYTEIKRTYNKFKDTEKKCLPVFENVRLKTAEHVVEKFNTVLQSRNYAGNLVFDHDREQLLVNFVTTRKGTRVLNTDACSGGERSFTTVAFIISLWTALNLPFYSMDEFDIFMDSMNRKAITELLISYALESRSQFIFLTPLTTSYIASNHSVEIFRLTDPRSE